MYRSFYFILQGQQSIVKDFNSTIIIYHYIHVKYLLQLARLLECTLNGNRELLDGLKPRVQNKEN